MIKKLFQYVLFAALGSFPIFALAQSAEGVPTNLYQGLKSSQVILLQQKLQSLGFLSSDSAPTGFFGALTKKAVQDFQNSKGIESTGFVGAQTRQALGGSTTGGIAPKNSTAVSTRPATNPAFTAALKDLNTSFNSVNALANKTSARLDALAAQKINVSLPRKYLADARLKLDEARAKIAIAKSAGLAALSLGQSAKGVDAMKNVVGFANDATNLINAAERLVNQSISFIKPLPSKSTTKK